MDTLFIFTLFSSVICFLVGLIRPKAFDKLFKGSSSRKKTSLAFGSATLASFVLFGLVAPPSSPSEATATENPAHVAQAEESTPTAQESASSNTAKQQQADIQVVPQDQPAPTPATPASSPAPATVYAVTQVVDGDTFKVSINGKTETIRLIGINTPETVDPRTTVECFGTEASNRAKALLTGKEVSLEADPTQGERDKYGRLLRYAFLENGTSFNKSMISDGYAYEYTYSTPYKYQAEYKQAQTEAQAAKRGLWSPDACAGGTTSAPAPTPTPAPAPTPTPTPAPTPAPAPAPAPSPVTGHIFYTSSYHTAKYYYCDTDDGWKSLSEKYLKSFPSAEELLKSYPDRVLHEPCK